ncbi:MAG: TraB/GumN family protein [Defluviitaleaceae bacterium]|nr:TraB/GumN family protein [Defluviitaleaceae bacterium]
MKHAKRILALVIAILFIAAVPVAASPLDNVPLRQENGVSYVSVRNAADAFDATVSWNRANQTVTITRADGSVRTLRVGEDGSFNRNGTIYMPVDLATRLFQVAAQAPPLSAPPLSPANSPIHGHIHRIEHAGSVAYLFGSFHGGAPDWFPLAPVVENAMARADVFAFEIDLLMDARETAAILESIQFLPAGQNARQLLGQNLYEQYVRTMNNWANYFGRQILENIDRVHPAFQMFILTQALEAATFSTGGSAVTVDGYVLAFAQERRRPVVGLMDFEAQHRIFLTPPRDITREMARTFPTATSMRATLETNGISEYDALMYYYAGNNAAGLMRVVHGSFNRRTETIVERYEREMGLNHRSTVFAEEIVRLMEEADAPMTLFVTVGISHLIRHTVGDDFTSIVEQLALMGIEAEPIF